MQIACLPTCLSKNSSTTAVKQESREEKITMCVVACLFSCICLLLGLAAVGIATGLGALPVPNFVVCTVMVSSLMAALLSLGLAGVMKLDRLHNPPKG